MKIAFFNSHIHWTPHYEVELELMQHHLTNNDSVVQLICNSQLPTCDINIHHDLHSCLACIGKREYGKDLLEGKVIQRSFLNLTARDKEEIKGIKKEFSNIKEMQELSVDNFDLGFAVSSSLISHFKDPSPDLSLHKIVVENYIISALGVYRSVQNYLKANKLDKLYVFNGRFAHVKAVLRACQSLGVHCIVHERGSSKNHYSLYHNTTPHDISYVKQRIKEKWEESHETEKTQIAEEFYFKRAKGIVKQWHSYTMDHKEDLFPDDWDPHKQNVVIYNSSEDEFASIGPEWKNPIYSTQVEGITRIIRDLEKYSNIHVYLRVHPNLKSKKSKDVEELTKISGQNFTLIPSDSLISSYSLLKNASKVLTFGSTMGIEATFWGIPSVLAGKTYYKDLGVTYNPATHEEVISYLIKEPLEAMPRVNTLAYGYYVETFGIPFKFYEGETLIKGRFKGRYITGKNKIIGKLLVWALYKPGIRNLKPYFNALHQKFLKSRYLRV